MNHVTDQLPPRRGRSRVGRGATFLILGALLLAWMFTRDAHPTPRSEPNTNPRQGTVRGREAPERRDAALPELEEKVLPSAGRALPVRWGDLGAQMLDAGVIDQEKLESLSAQRGGLNEEERALLQSTENGNLTIHAKNAAFLLNLLWALGLANENAILEEGPMRDPQYGGADHFASTGGWTLARGNAMDHYGAHAFITLTEEQQEIVQRVSGNIYRPCCDNPTSFPDCNHGMAMLGLLELMASQGLTEDEMYRVALQVNAFWFPDTYLTLATYFQKRGVDWKDASPREVLGAPYSSAAGYRKILADVGPSQSRGGSRCGV